MFLVVARNRIFITISSKNHTHDDRYFTESEITTKLSSNNDKLSVSVVTPTINSLSTVASNTIYVTRYGNIVTVVFNATLSESISDWSVLVSGLPKPKYIFHTTVANFNSSFKRSLRLLINTTGELKIRYGTAIEYNGIYTYVCV
jgi:hypothetical protein